jgi:alkylhydroperoxidase family enzyme
VADHRTAELAPRERAICDYAVKLSIEPWNMVESDLESMRACGLDEIEISENDILHGAALAASR